MNDEIKAAIEYGAMRYQNEHWDSKKSESELQAEEVCRVVARRDEKVLGQFRAMLGLDQKFSTCFHDILTYLTEQKRAANDKD